VILELSKRFSNLKSWRWRPGMLTMNGDRVKFIDAMTGIAYLDRGFVTLDNNNYFAVAYPPLDKDDSPNPYDFATFGSMIEVIEMASGLCTFFTVSKETGLCQIEMWNETRNFSLSGASKEEAILAVFEFLEENI
jgi:hypothetical protein